MDDSLRQQAEVLLAKAPCSVEMPAGTGKTHLLTAATAVAAEHDKRSLILTHTNAGVDAIRTRLKAFGVPSGFVRVDTITSWAFALARSYSDIAQLSVPEVPDWSQSDDYVQGATRVAGAIAIKQVHVLSFSYLLVDEYQDCTLVQHEFIVALTRAVPKAVVFGDELQAIFGFAGPLASWLDHVLGHFPVHSIATHPHRWTGHNDELGSWLLSIRQQLVDGATIDLTAHNVRGLVFVNNNGPTALVRVTRSLRNTMESIVVLDKWPNDVANHASRLGGSYSVMEDINGSFMREQLESLPAEGDFRLALWFAKLAKQCAAGLAGIDQAVLGHLESNQRVTHYRRTGLEDVLSALDAIRSCPTYAQIAAGAAIIRRTTGVHLYRWEAWRDTMDAIASTDENDEPAIENLARIRDRLRRAGRGSATRIASRPVLVKGLEFDHVIIANLANFCDPRNLYVALSRGRKSITIIGRSSSITLRKEN